MRYNNHCFSDFCCILCLKKEMVIIMKKIISVILSALCILSLLCGCTKSGSNFGSNKSDKLSIVTTIFPEYDWTREILGDKLDNFELTMLLDNGVDLHNYQPTASDMIKISSCDIFIYVGGESDEWVEDAIEDAKNKDMIVINLMKTLRSNVLVEETVEGMENAYRDDDDLDDDDDDDLDDDDDDDDIELDEHIWLSLNNAKICCRKIASSIGIIDPENKDFYTENADNYTASLASLENEYKDAVKASSKNTLLFADRFPFRYLTEDLGLKYYAAFSGCSAESEASFKTVKFLANKINELNLNCVIALEGSNQKIAKTVISTSNADNVKIVVLDSMQTTTSADAKNNTTYLSISKTNLEALKEALK